MPATEDSFIVLTGCGWVTPFAAGTIAEILAAARSRSTPPEPQDGYWAVPDDLLQSRTGLSKELQRDKAAAMTAVALEHALEAARIERDSLDGRRVGMVLGCALAGQLGMIDFANEVRQQTPRFVSPIHFPQTVGNYISGALARGYDVRGPNLTLACGAASGLDAVVEGAAAIAAGTADIVLAGGADRLSPALARGLSRPGVILSEGACMFVLERASAAAARGATPLAKITRARRLDGGESPPVSADGAIVSEACVPQPGAVCIEHWVGCCCGALGSAAVAAAIGATTGNDVPLRSRNNPRQITVGPVAQPSYFDGQRTVPVVVIAAADDAHRTVLEIEVSCAP